MSCVINSSRQPTETTLGPEVEKRMVFPSKLRQKIDPSVSSRPFDICEAESREGGGGTVYFCLCIDGLVVQSLCSLTLLLY